jgi:hypothetical protein
MSTFMVNVIGLPAFGAHRFLVRLPGTNPLDGMTFPKKGTAGFHRRGPRRHEFNASEKRRAETVDSFGGDGTFPPSTSAIGTCFDSRDRACSMPSGLEAGG